MKRYTAHILLAYSALWCAVAYYNDADWVAYLPCLGGVLAAYRFQ